MMQKGLLRQLFVPLSWHKKEPPEGGLKFHMFEQIFLFLIYNSFAMSDGYVEFFRQRFITAAVYQPSLQDRSVPLVMDVFVNQFSDLTVSILHWAPRKNPPGATLGDAVLFLVSYASSSPAHVTLSVCFSCFTGSSLNGLLHLRHSSHLRFLRRMPLLLQYQLPG